jgi:starch synthase (maltosyl-transferring)
MTVEEGRKRVVIEGVTPEVDGGRFAAKRIVGDLVEIEADVFADGNDEIAALLLYRHADETAWHPVAMQLQVNDRWLGSFVAHRTGRYLYTLEAGIDGFASWRRDLKKRAEAEQDLALQFKIGVALIDAVRDRSEGADARRLDTASRALQAETTEGEKLLAALDEEVLEIMARNADHSLWTRYGAELPLVVDPLKARFSSWYELFPRSASQDGRHGTFDDVVARLPSIASMGFDVLYLPPIHPVGQSYRKGPNNALQAAPDDPGSPWAIGSDAGGHQAIHPELGNEESFSKLVAAARALGIDLALDIAFQASPDHPMVRQHPEWFRRLPDGTIQYAENPPKKYQDIYPFDFESSDWRGLWDYLLSIFLHWCSLGVFIFRVDNPHTKPFPFWEWCIGEVKRRHPDTIFLAEAFTRPKVMYYLAKLGFSQSYTYFAWRNEGWELVQYFTELTKPPLLDYFRSNLWPNTPDILTEYLQLGGRPAFIIRLMLAATLGANYGIYGPSFELMEHVPREDGSEEYLNSEKYQVRQWNLESPDSLRYLIARVNQLRRDHPALQNDWSLRFHPTSDEQIVCFSKSDKTKEDLFLVAINLDPFHPRAGVVHLDLEALGITDDSPFEVHDQLTDSRYIWRGSANYVGLNPSTLPGHLFVVRKPKSQGTAA